MKIEKISPRRFKVQVTTPETHTLSTFIVTTWDGKEPKVWWVSPHGLVSWSSQVRKIVEIS